MTQLSDTTEILVREAVPSSDTVRERFAAIDGLRALAILAIVAYEAFALVPALAMGRPPLAIALDGASQGIALFLLLSGFTLGYPAIVALTESGRAYLDLARFAVKRVLRIYPVYLLALVFALAIPPVALFFGLPALHGADRPIASDVFVRNALFVGDGLGNDGFRALAIVARLYVLFPLLLLLWSRSGPIFAAALAVIAVLDTTTGLHGLGIGALVPFMLGIVAASVRAQNLPAYRFGIPLALAAGAAALAWGPAIDGAAASHAAGVLRIDPLWSLALFGLLAAVTAIHPLERLCAFAPIRLLSASSFAISLVVVPVSAFAVRQLATKIGPLGAGGNAMLASIVAGVLLWKLADRSFVDGDLRRNVADAIAPHMSGVLARVKLHRIVLGNGVAPATPASETTAPRFDATFYAPPPRPDAALVAVVSRRSGSPEELAAEILATKKRLAERSAAIFADPKPVVAPVPHQKPGFYRKPSKALAAGTPAPATNGSRQSSAGEPGYRVAAVAAPPAIEEPQHTRVVEAVMPLFDTMPCAAKPDLAPDDDGLGAAGATARTKIKMRIGRDA
ncbi:MAG: hypothetical protein NVS1B2_26630 [Vulcanimicrobiaceae bacterium]